MGELSARSTPGSTAASTAAPTAAAVTAGAGGPRHTSLGSALLVLAGASLFGTVGTAQALGPDVPPTSLAAARLLLTAVCFWLAVLALGRVTRVAPLVATRPVLLAGVGQAGFNLFFLAALREAGVAVGTLVAIGATPVVAGLLTRHVTRRWAVATAVAVTGLVLLVTGQGEDGDAVTLLGVGLALAAATSYATYIIGGNQAEQRGFDTQSTLAAAFSVSAVLSLPWLLLGEKAWLGTGPGWAVLGFLVAVPTLLAYSLFNRGLRGVRASTASTLGLVEPVVAAVLAYLVLGERLSAAGVAGAVLILVGLLVIVRGGQVGESPRA